MKSVAIVATGFLAACAASQPIIRTEQVPVTKYVKQSIPAALLAPCTVVEPDRACWRDMKPEFCNGQLVEMLTDYRAALQQCNSDKANISEATK